MDSQEETKVIKDIFENDRSMNGSEVIEWMHSDNLDVRFYAFRALFERSGRIIGSISSDVAISYCLGFLFDVICNESFYPELGQFDACQYLRYWFLKLWGENPRNEKLLQRIKNILARLSLDCGSQAAESVTLVIMEHIFCNEEIRKYFEDWSYDPQLAGRYAEAIKLANGWSDLELGDTT